MTKKTPIKIEKDYDSILSDLSDLIEQSRKMAAHSVNKTMVKTYSKFNHQVSIKDLENINNPLTLKFLGLKDEYEGKNLKECYLISLENFFLKNSFASVVTHKEIKIDNKKYRVDLVLYNRRLRCLVIIDLKIGELDHADIGQMLLYTNYANEHWRIEDENPSIGLILCAEKNDALAHYTLENLPNKVLAKEYKTVLPDEKILTREIEKNRKMLSGRII